MILHGCYSTIWVLILQVYNYERGFSKGEEKDEINK